MISTSGRLESVINRLYVVENTSNDLNIVKIGSLLAEMGAGSVREGLGTDRAPRGGLGVGKFEPHNFSIV